MKKERFLALQKHLGGSYTDAKIIANFINKLTPEWFEQYVTDFFRQESLGFHSIRTGGFNDRGIDVKADRANEDWSRTFLIIQCKKWEAYHIKENDVALFYGKVADTAREATNPEKIHDCQVIFVATTWFTLWAKQFCEEKNIQYVDYRGLLEFNSEYPLDAWITQMQKNSDSSRYLAEYPLNETQTSHLIESGKHKAKRDGADAARRSKFSWSSLLWKHSQNLIYTEDI